MWLPKKLIKPNTSEYAQGVEVCLGYKGEVPEDFDIIELPAAKCLMFQGEPFEDEGYSDAIGYLWCAIKKYDPKILGYKWDGENPRIQLKPQGSRGLH